MSGWGRRWVPHDRYGNGIYLTQERWEHIINPLNHPEMEIYEDFLVTTLKQGRRQQEPLNPLKYRYYHYFAALPDEANHVVAIVLFGLDMDQQGRAVANNYVTTAFFKHMRPRK